MQKRILFPFLFLALLVWLSCQENVEAPVTSERVAFSDGTSLTIKEARGFYYKDLKKRPVASGTGQKNGKEAVKGRYPLWAFAMITKNDNYLLVEVPMAHTQKEVGIIKKDKNSSDPNSDQDILAASLSRLVIYKDKNGKITERLVSYVPDAEYLKRHDYDISHNTVNKLDPDFDGTLTFTNWDGSRSFILDIKNGKATKRFTSSNKSKRDNKNGRMVCEWQTIEHWIQYCVVTYPDGPDQEGVEDCMGWELQSIEDVQVCSDDGTGEDDPCLDPENYDYCYGDGGGGGGDGGCFDLCNPACINYNSSQCAINTALFEIINNLDPCRADILNRLSQGNNTVGTILALMAEKVDIDHSPQNFEVTYEAVPTLYDPSKPGMITSGTTTALFYEAGPRIFSCTVQLAEDVYNTATDVYTANTTMHETIHAFMGSLLYRVQYGNMTIDQIRDLSFPEMFDDYVNVLVNSNQSELAALSADRQYDHNIMANTLVEMMSNALAEFDGRQQNQEFYWSVVWAGLQQTETWQMAQANPSTNDNDLRFMRYALTSARMAKIMNIIEAERTGQTFNGQTVKGNTPKPTGCY